MFKILQSLTKSITGIMSAQRSIRYFPNPKPDYQKEIGTPLIPTEDLKNSLHEILEKITSHIKPIEKNAGDGLYLGTAGIAYMYYHLSKIPTLEAQRSGFLNKAVEYLKPALMVASCTTHKKKDVPSFILSNCGIYAVAAAIFNATGDESQCKQYIQMYYEAATICKEFNFLSCGSDELFVGRAGYILGALWMAKETNTPLPMQDIYELCKIIVQSGRTYSKRHQLPCPLMYAYYQVEYLGAAHGLSSILQLLISVPGYLDAAPSDASDIKRSIDYLLSLQGNEGNFPAATDEIGYQSELVHWCHGAGGMIYLMAKAYLVFKEDKYLQSCKRMADLIWNKGLLKKGPGLCHGVAGNGYAFLLMFRLTADVKYLYRAIEFYNFMNTNDFKHVARKPDHPYSLYEGLAGTACYVADLTHPNTAHFPFSDVFTMIH